MIGKILGSKKTKYVLEFDQAQGDKAPEQPAPEKKAEVAPEKTAEPAAKTAEVVTEAAQPAATEAPKSKPAKAKPEAKKPVEVAASAPKPEPTKDLAPLNSIQPTPKDLTFAPNYLMPKPTASRRRPGPSLNMFMDMARQVGRR